MADPAEKPPVEDLYAKWDLPRNASQADIVAKKRELWKKWHPDQIGETEPGRQGEFEEKFKQVGQDFNWLEDPKRREAYDAVLVNNEKERLADEAREAEYEHRAGQAAEDPDQTQQFEEAFSTPSAAPGSTGPTWTPPPPPPPSPAPEPVGPAPRDSAPSIARLLTIGFWLFVLFLGYKGCAALSNLGDGSPSGKSSQPNTTNGQRRIVGISRSPYAKATVLDITQRTDIFIVKFVVIRRDSFYRFPPPDKSCVEVDGAQHIPPANIRLTESKPDRYAGAITFGYGDPGLYRFRYGCLFSRALLFERLKRAKPVTTITGTVGVSRSLVSNPYEFNYAKVGPVEVYPAYFVVHLDAQDGFGGSGRSCVKRGGESIRPVDLSVKLSQGNHEKTSLTFPLRGPGTYAFEYECALSSVKLFTR
jgi:hypothetical protein